MKIPRSSTALVPWPSTLSPVNMAFFENETDVVLRMARSVHGTDCGTFYTEQLSVSYGLLARVGSVLVDGTAELWIKLQKIRNTSGVIAMPMCEQHMRKLNVHLFQCLCNQIGPFRLATTRVDEQPYMARTDNVGVSSLERELWRKRSVGFWGLL